MIGAFIPRNGQTVGCFDPMRVLLRLEQHFGDEVTCDWNNAFEGQVQKYTSYSEELGMPKDNVVVHSEMRKTHAFGPRYHFRLQVGPDQWVDGKVDGQSIYLFYDDAAEIPEPMRSRFVAFLQTLQLGECTVEIHS
jgi:hypothetical protein